MSGILAVRHERVSLALHALRAGEGRALLLLHALYGDSSGWQAVADGWRGAVYGLDFSGHGGSDWVTGGGYSPELLAGDADAALARVGPACVVGAGLGAWIALLVAGARPERVPAALLLPGAGLAGVGPLPEPERGVSEEWLRLSDARLPHPVRGAPGIACDPLVFQLERDVRPVDYAEAFAARAARLVLVEDGSFRPPWWEAVAKSPATRRIGAGEVSEALRALAGG